MFQRQTACYGIFRIPLDEEAERIDELAVFLLQSKTSRPTFIYILT